jgi:hypothetical protein
MKPLQDLPKCIKNALSNGSFRLLWFPSPLAAQVLLVDMAAIAPQLFGQSLGPLVFMLDQDDPLLASCATKILAKAGRYLAAASQGKKEAEKEWQELVAKVGGRGVGRAWVASRASMLCRTAWEDGLPEMF